MKKLFVLAMAAVFSLGVGQVSYVMAQDKKAEEKKDAKSEKMDKKDDKKADKKADKKTDKKDAANPCAAKADKK